MLQSAARKLVGGRKIYYGWVVVATTFVIFTVVFGIQFSFGIFFKPLQDTFGWSRATTSWAMTIHLTIFALFMLPIARLLERFSTQKLFAVSAPIVGLSLVLCSRISQPWQLYLLYGVILGISISTYGPTPLAIITRWFKEKRGIALGIAACGTGFGTMVGAPLTNSLIATYGWRNAFLILGVASGIILLTCARFVRSAPPAAGIRGELEGKTSETDRQPTRPPALRGMTLSQTIRTKEIFLIIAAHASGMFAIKMVMVHIARHAIDIGVSPPVAALAMGTIGGVSIIGRLSMGLVQDKIGPRRSILICLGVQALTMLALPFIRSDLLFFAYAAGFGFTYGGDVPQYPAITAQYFGLASIGVIYSLVMTIGNLAGALGPIMAGYVFDLTGSYTIVFLGSALGLLVGLFCIWRLPTHD